MKLAVSIIFFFKSYSARRFKNKRGAIFAIKYSVYTVFPMFLGYTTVLAFGTHEDSHRCVVLGAMHKYP
jgi:hypothetical protein